MEGSLYNIHGRKNKLTNQVLAEAVNTASDSEIDLISLVKENKSQLHILQKERVLAAFCNSIKNLLELDDIKVLISSLFDIELALNSFKESGVLINELPDFRDFYSSLSPILLRSVLEHDLNSEDSDQLLKGWLGALRIALEEDLYIWQEKIM